jgi:hypothetical protein
MHGAREQTGNPGFSHSRYRESRDRPFPVPGIPGLAIAILAIIFFPSSIELAAPPRRRFLQVLEDNLGVP